jgi:hypothetical protein
VEFDRCAHDYRVVVNDALRVAGVDVDRMASYKARLLLALMEQALGDPKTLKVPDVGCGVRLIGRTGRTGPAEPVRSSARGRR